MKNIKFLQLNYCKNISEIIVCEAERQIKNQRTR